MTKEKIKAAFFDIDGTLAEMKKYCCFKRSSLPA